MKIEALKINLVQRILNIRDSSVLEEIDSLINSTNIIGYDGKGKPITEEDYMMELDTINKDIDGGSVEFLSSAEVKQKIIDENSLA